MKYGVLALSNGDVLWSETAILSRFHNRCLGLLCERGLAGYKAYWFPRCQSIHTYGMCFALDVIGLTAKQQICHVQRNVQPNRILRLRGVDSLIEIAAGCRYPLEQWLGERLFYSESSPLSAAKTVAGSLEI